MGGINTLGGLNIVGVDYRPEANPAAPDAANANQPQQGGDIQDDGDIIHNGEPPARPASLIRQLDTLLLNAAGKSVSASAETKGKAISETLCEKDIITAEESDKLDSLAKDAADKLKALDNFSGRELAKALMTKSGDLVWRKGFFGGMKPVTVAVKAAVEAQEALSAALAKLNDRIAQSDEVDAKLQEEFTELQFQCDRRATEIFSIIVRMHDLAQQDAVSGVIDPQVTEYLDATFKELMPREAILMHGTAEALETMRAKFTDQMQPLAEKLEAFASDGNKTLSVQEVAELDAAMASMRNTLAHVRGNGIEIGNGRTEVDKSLLDAMEKVIDEAKEQIDGAKEESVMRARRAFHRDVLQTLDLYRLPDGRNLMDGGGKDNHVLKKFVTATENLANLLEQFETGARPMGQFDRAFLKCAVKFPASDTLYDAMVEAHFDEKVADNFIKAIGGMDIIAAQFKELMRTGEALKANAADSSLVAEDVRKIMLGEERLSVYVEAKSRGFQRGDVDPNADETNIASGRRLGSGIASTTYLLTTKSGGELVFKPELDGRLGLNRLNLGIAGKYLEEQTTANLNLATQDAAKAFGCEDIIVKYSVGVHDGQFGTFMEKAKGYSGEQFMNKYDGGNSGIAPSELKDRIPDIVERQRIQAQIAQKLNRLMWLDVITGQGDRHWGNYFVHIDENTHEVTVKGIDNDASFSSVRIGVQKYVITGQIATIMLDRLREISNLIHKDDGPGEYTNRLLKDPGLTINEADGTVVVDLAKVKSPEIGMATMSTLGLKCTAMPQEIDKEFYDKLIEMDKNTAKKREYLQSIAPRISPDALRAAEMRLDDAIAHAKTLEAKGKVYSSEQWNNTHVLRNMPRMKDGVTMELSYGYTEVVGKNIGIVKEYVENNTPSFFTRENFHKMFA